MHLLENNFDPGHVYIHITYPDGLGHVMVKAITPLDDERCLLTHTVLRTDTEADRPAAEIFAFDDEVEGEDRDLLEALPKDFPLAKHLNAHARADRNSLAIRRLWTDLVTGRFTPPRRTPPDPPARGRDATSRLVTEGEDRPCDGRVRWGAACPW